MTKQETSNTPISVEIHEVTYPGRGVGRLDDGRVVFVDGALPGESVQMVLTRQHKRFAEGQLVAVNTPSPARIDPECPLAAKRACPGCSYQHVTYAAELDMKTAQLGSLLQRLGHIDAPTIEPPVGSPAPLGYRNKIGLHTGRKPGGKALGYLGHNNRTVVNVTHCPLAVEPINQLLDVQRGVHEWLKRLPRDTRVTFRYTPTDGPLWWHAHNPQAGPRMLTENTCLGELAVPRTGFFQVNPAVADLLLGAVMDLVGERSPARVIDAFCGVGIFALAAAKAGCPEVCGFDTNSEAIGCARANARTLKVDGCSFFAAAATDALGRLKPTPKTLLILDPPRAGLESVALEAVLQLEPAEILYISCAPDTLARDVRTLHEKGGYELASARVYDMFARTSSFETFCLLTKGE